MTDATGKKSRDKQEKEVGHIHEKTPKDSYYF
jgi:hypothetical protein